MSNSIWEETEKCAEEPDIFEDESPKTKKDAPARHYTVYDNYYRPCVVLLVQGLGEVNARSDFITRFTSIW